jgi:Ca-activated chloride channel family protein
MFADVLRRTGLGRTARFAAAALALVLLVRDPAVVTVTAQRPTFRSDSEALWITATVIDRDGRLVTDLARDDFEVLDNGVARDITVFHNDAVPFAMAILFDVSGSLVWNSYTMRQAVNELIARFQPGDRATIGAFWGVAEITPRFTANPKTLLGWVNATVAGVGVPCVSSMTNAPGYLFAPRSAGSAVWNAIQCGIDAVSKDAETPRRVVLVITDGMDNASVLGPQDVGRYAAQLGVMVYAIGMPGIQGLDESPLRTLAQDTGGGYYKLLDRDDLPRTIARIAEELRHQYVFGVTPAGDGSTHKLEVRMRRANTIARARRVYMEAPPVATIPVATARPERVDSTAATVPSGLSGSVIESMDRYERGGRPLSFDSVQAFTSSFENLRKAAPAWIRVDPSQQARRRLAIAAYALDLINANPDVVADGPVMRVADPGLRETFAWNLGALASPSAADVVEWACSVLQEGPPLPAERTWHVAAIAVLERFRGQSALESHIAHAEGRFPKDPEWALARAVHQELQTWPDRRDEAEYRPPSGLTASRIAARFEEAAGFTATHQEAHLRWGYFELRRGRADEALTHFGQVGEPGDAVLRYWLHLFKGRALERVGRLEEAIASYRLAFSEVPYAQSATTALAVALVAHRQADEAAALTNRMLSAQPPLDPWNFYTFPATRLWQTLMSQLREAVKP